PERGHEVPAGRQTDHTPKSNGTHSWQRRVRVKMPHYARTLFDSFVFEPSTGEPVPPPPEEIPAQAPAMPPADEALIPDLATSCSPHAPFMIASGEKAKTRDIITAIRTLKTIEQEKRAATGEE